MSGVMLSLTMIFVAGFYERGKLQEPYQLFYKMVENGVASDSILYATVMEGHFERGDLEDAFKLDGKMSAEGLECGVIANKVLINRFFMEGEIREAKSLFKEMLASGLAPTRMAHAALISGFYEEQKKLLEEKAKSLSETGERVLVRNDMINQQTERT